MSYSESLSLEQEFEIKLFADQLQTLSLDQVKELSLELYRRMIFKDNLYEELFKDFLESSSPPVSA